MKSGFVLLVAASLAVPTFAAAADLPAGFAPNSIWLSSTHITTGDTVTIFTVVYNSSGQSLAGDVNFTVDGASVGSDTFTIKAGDTQIESVSWTAATGSHSAYAQVEDVSDADTKAAESVLNQKTGTITFAVAAAPPPTPTQQALNTAENVVTTSAPAVGNAAQQVFAAAEGVRQGIVDALQKQLAPSAPSVQGHVLGTSTLKAAPQESGSFFSSVWQSILGALLFICKLPVLFYASALLVVYILYKLLRTWLRERRYRN